MTAGTGQAGGLGQIDLEARLSLERYRQVSRMMPMLYLAHTINGLAIGIASQGDFPWIYKLVLPPLLVVACLWQFWVWQRRAHEDVDAGCARRRLRRAVGVITGLCFAGGLWALGAYQTVTYDDLLLAPVFALVLGLSTALCFAAVPRVPQLLLGLVLTPVTVAMLLQPGHELRSIAISVMVVSVLMVRLATLHARGVETTLRLQDKLERQALFDSLTGLANRHAFATAFENARQDASETDSLALLMVDLDGFKQANDTFGHVAGDGVLVETADRLKQLFADARLIARFGGDEFVLLFASQPRGDWPERIAAASRVMALPVADGLHTIPISASFGLAQAVAAEAHLDHLLIAADEELYADKAQRRSNVRRRA